jgi:murein DD-endopeptidase MepM/ murein hydrolase activator NlpD
VLGVRAAADALAGMRLPTHASFMAAAALVLPAQALAESSGGASPPARPVATLLRVTPAVVQAPALPRIAVRFASPEPGRVVARVVVHGRRGRPLRLELGRVRPGATVLARWRRGTRLRPGRYRVRVDARGPSGLALARSARAPGRTALAVRAPAPPPPPPVPASAFPVAGPHAYGDGFGAPRHGYAHQGQDLAGAEGTPVVAPLAGTVSTVGDQPSGAGVYVVERAADGHDLFFAHCQLGSARVLAGQPVAVGQPLCAVGHTGDATGPHLHLEVWEHGWRAGPASRPIDPLPLLRLWER